MGKGRTVVTERVVDGGRMPRPTRNFLTLEQRAERWRLEGVDVHQRLLTRRLLQAFRRPGPARMSSSAAWLPAMTADGAGQSRQSRSAGHFADPFVVDRTATIGDPHESDRVQQRMAYRCQPAGHLRRNDRRSWVGHKSPRLAPTFHIPFSVGLTNDPSCDRTTPAFDET